uniref:PDZ domain-containing protein n=1 Tax=Noctiluca scintillans TaxID=2966 RepID=A0A7S1EWV9_NOCSC
MGNDTSCCTGVGFEGDKEISSPSLQVGGGDEAVSANQIAQQSPFSTPEKREFEIRLDKSNKQPLGIDVDLADERTMLVEKMAPAGLLHDWNRANPDKEVNIGDRIIDVNGTSGNARAMTSVCKAEVVLVMTVRKS